MTSISTKELPKTVYTKTILSIVVSLGGIAIFLTLASNFLISQPIGSTVQGLFFDDSLNVDSESTLSRSHSASDGIANPFEDRGLWNLMCLRDCGYKNNSWRGDSESAGSGGGDDDRTEVAKQRHHESRDKDELTGSRLEEFKDSKDKTLHYNGAQEENENKSFSLSDTSFQKNVSISSDNMQKELKKSMLSSATTKNLSLATVDAECDLYHGKWIHESTGPLYTNDSCPALTQTQNCQGNGRPDKDYENWRWKPHQCDLPRFDAKKFLELMRGKTIAFIGDSIARNQMESLLCILWQVEVPQNKGNKKMQRHYFESTSTTIIRIWSSWLVHQTTEPFDFAPDGVVKIHLDKPDKYLMERIMDFDVVVLSSGRWFAKQSVYILNNEIVGGQLWWPDHSRQKKIDNIEAFAKSVETILSSIVTHPNYTGLTIVRSFSPDHYEGGSWNTGGSCTGKVRPVLDGELVENEFTNKMHEKQVTGFKSAMKKKTNESRMKLMDITEAFSYRHDGHPGPYRSLDPKKITTRSPDGRPPPQDCLHWCMPGPVDTWNELVFEIIRSEFHQSQKNSSS